MSKRTTIHDIAKALDVTAATVSRALKDNPKISESTRKTVQAMAKKMNYQPNSIAAALRKGTSNLIGVLIPTIDRNFFGSVVRGMEEVFNDTPYNVIICQSNDSSEKEIANIKALLEARVDGILASYAKETLDFSHFRDIMDQGIPLILFDRVTEELNTDSVIIDDRQISFNAVSHLIGQGCKRIAHFGGPDSVSIYRNRRLGYEDALRKHGIEVKEEYIFTVDLNIENGRALGRQILGMDMIPDAVFSSSDYAAIGALQYLKDNGIRVPEDMGFVGFSNEAFTELVDPPLSTIDQHSKQMGRYAAELMLERLSGNYSGESPRKTVLNPELIIRTSSMITSQTTNKV